MRIGGLQKFSLIDYPGLISAVIFTQGCNFRCPYCHNPELVLPDRFEAPIDPEDVFAFLDSRKGKIEGVVISGGEPTLQEDLLHCLKRIKERSFKVKLDTNGSRPDVVKHALDNHLLDFIAMDIKAPPDSYFALSGVEVNMHDIEKSIDLVLCSGIEHLFKTTVVPNLFTNRMKKKIKRWMADLKANHIFQDFVPSDILDPAILTG